MSARPLRWARPAIAALLPPNHDRAEGTPVDAWLSQVAAATRSALQQLGLQAKLLSETLTPNSALLRFAGTAKLTTELVLRKRSELLTMFGLNVISMRPEPGALALAIERPGARNRRDRHALVGMGADARDLGQQRPARRRALGRREALVLSPGGRHAPHTLIAGSTGRGKSVLMQNIILAIAATNTPEQAKIVVIDPKQGVDYFLFEDPSHMAGGRDRWPDPRRGTT